MVRKYRINKNSNVTTWYYLNLSKITFVCMKWILADWEKGWQIFLYTNHFFIYLAAIPNPVGETVTPSPLPPNPCDPPPCGLNSQCQVVAGQAQCACLTNMVGNPPDCRPECVLSSNCPSNEACVNQKCVDPCAGTCGPNADCRVVNHAPSCTCKTGFTGNAFADCRPISAVGKNHNLLIAFPITVSTFYFKNVSIFFRFFTATGIIVM